jgi:hypothetical protein
MQIGATPLPVAIQERPPDPLWAYWVPGLGLLFGFLAAIFAGGALLGIYKQIKIGNEQSKLSRDALALARDEFDASMRALDLQEKQFAFFQAEQKKSSNIIVLVNGQEDTVGVETGESIVFDFDVLNKGNKPAEDCQINVYVPADWRTDVEVMKAERQDWGTGLAGYTLDVHPPKYQPLDDAVSVEGIPERVRSFSARVGDKVVQGVRVNVCYIKVWVPDGEHTIYWTANAEGKETFGQVFVIAG